MSIILSEAEYCRLISCRHDFLGELRKSLEARAIRVCLDTNTSPVPVITWPEVAQVLSRFEAPVKIHEN